MLFMAWLLIDLCAQKRLIIRWKLLLATHFDMMKFWWFSTCQISFPTCVSVSPILRLSVFVLVLVKCCTHTSLRIHTVHTQTLGFYVCTGFSCTHLFFLFTEALLLTFWDNAIQYYCHCITELVHVALTYTGAYNRSCRVYACTYVCFTLCYNNCRQCIL